MNKEKEVNRAQMVTCRRQYFKSYFCMALFIYVCVCVCVCVCFAYIISSTNKSFKGVG